MKTFTLCDENGNKYEVRKFKTFATTQSEDETIDSKLVERPVYRLIDEREVIEIDGSFEILDPPNNIKLFDCK